MGIAFRSRVDRDCHYCGETIYTGETCEWVDEHRTQRAHTQCQADETAKGGKVTQCGGVGVGGESVDPYGPDRSKSPPAGGKGGGPKGEGSGYPVHCKACGKDFKEDQPGNATQCPSCDSGNITGDTPAGECETCNGSGADPTATPWIDGEDTGCPDCQGTGEAQGNTEEGGSQGGQGESENGSDSGSEGSSEGSENGEGEQGNEGESMEDNEKDTERENAVKSAAQKLFDDMKEEMREQIKEEVEKGVKEEMEEARKDMPSNMTFKDAEGKSSTKMAHKCMRLLLDVVRRRNWAFCWGPTGSGKSTGARLAATAVGQRYAYVTLSPQTSEIRLFGYMDGNGNYLTTVFHDFYENGGVFCIDEYDNASPSLLAALNSLLDDGEEGSFPNGMCKRHQDFILIVCGNTPGRGGTPQYPERRRQDGATQDRFVQIFWPVDEVLEREAALAKNDTPAAKKWVAWVQHLREVCNKTAPHLIVSPRASIRGVEFLVEPMEFTVPELAEAHIWRGIDPDTIVRVLQVAPYPTLVELPEAEVAPGATAPSVTTEGTFNGMTEDEAIKAIGEATTKLLKNNEKVKAVQNWKNFFNVSLKEAKLRVDGIEQDMKRDGKLA